MHAWWPRGHRACARWRARGFAGDLARTGKWVNLVKFLENSPLDTFLFLPIPIPSQRPEIGIALPRSQ